jgi:hypothetical protein
MKRRRIFLDMDGVLADFDSAVEDIFGFDYKTAEERVGTKVFWKTIHAVPRFYAELPVMADAYSLVIGVEDYDPTPVILTGLPWGGWALAQKKAWRDKYFPHLYLIGCSSKDKCLYADPGDIIIDDRVKYRQPWVDMGGTWITHTSAKDSLEQLKEVWNGFHS